MKLNKVIMASLLIPSLNSFASEHGGLREDRQEIRDNCMERAEKSYEKDRDRCDKRETNERKECEIKAEDRNREMRNQCERMDYVDKGAHIAEKVIDSGGGGFGMLKKVFKW